MPVIYNPKAGGFQSVAPGTNTSPTWAGTNKPVVPTTSTPTSTNNRTSGGGGGGGSSGSSPTQTFTPFTSQAPQTFAGTNVPVAGQQSTQTFTQNGQTFSGSPNIQQSTNPSFLDKLGSYIAPQQTVPTFTQNGQTFSGKLNTPPQAVESKVTYYNNPYQGYLVDGKVKLVLPGRESLAQYTKVDVVGENANGKYIYESKTGGYSPGQLAEKKFLTNAGVIKDTPVSAGTFIETEATPMVITPESYQKVLGKQLTGGKQDYEGYKELGEYAKVMQPAELSYSEKSLSQQIFGVPVFGKGLAKIGEISSGISEVDYILGSKQNIASKTYGFTADFVKAELGFYDGTGLYAKGRYGQQNFSPIAGVLKGFAGAEYKSGTELKQLSVDLKNPILSTTSYAAGVTADLAGDLTPKNILEVAELYGGYKAYTAAPKIVGTIFTAQGVNQAINGQTSEEKIKGGIIAGLTGLGFINDLKLPGFRTAREAELSLRPEAPTRQRPTLVIKESGTDRILLEIDRNTGQAILPGGGINKGETPRQAAIRETGEELLGLKGKSANEIEKVLQERGLEVSKKETDIIQTEEERYTVFEAKVKDLDKFILTLTPQQNEISGLRIIDNVKDYTGKRAGAVFGETGEPFLQKLKPFRQAAPEIRSQDLLILSRSKEMKEFNLLSEPQKEALVLRGKNKLIEIGGEERVSQIEKQFGSKELARDIFLIERGKGYKRLVVKGNKKIVVGAGSRYNIPFEDLKEYKSQDLQYLSASPVKPELGLLSYSDKGVGKLLKKEGLPKDINSQFEVIGSKSKRGGEGIYFQPPTTSSIETSEIYLGASYLGIFGKSSEGAKITFRKPKPVVLIKTGDEGLIQTFKGKAGIEFERAAPAGTQFRIKSQGKSFGLQGYKIRRFEIENVKEGTLSKSEFAKEITKLVKIQKQQSDSELLSNKIYVSHSSLIPRELSNPIRLSKQIYSAKENLVREKPIKYSEPYNLTTKEKNIVYETSKSSYSEPYSTKYKTETYKPSYNYKEITEYKYNAKENLYKYNITKKPKKLLYMNLDEPNKKRKKKSKQGFDLFEIKNRRPTLIRTGLSRQSALDLGARDVLSDLKATFFLKPSKSEGIDLGTTGDFSRAVEQNLFRKPVKNSKYNKLGQDIFIQRQSTPYGGRLRSIGEKESIKRYKKLKYSKYLQ